MFKNKKCATVLSPMSLDDKLKSKLGGIPRQLRTGFINILAGLHCLLLMPGGE